MKLSIIMLFNLLLLTNFTQAQSADIHAVTQSFEDHYNNNAYKEVFKMFSPEMQSALPEENTVQFLTGLKLQAGNISSRDLVKVEGPTFATYKTTFERNLFSLEVSIDKNSKINGLLIKPYVDKEDVPDVENKLSMSGLSESQSEVVFDHCRYFPVNSELSIAIIEGGKVSYHGLLHKEGEGLIDTDNSQDIFEIGSISKVMTSTLLASAHLAGEMELSDPIAKHLDLSDGRELDINFTQLANHTSGLPVLPTNLDLSKADPNNPYVDYGSEQLLAAMVELEDAYKSQQNNYTYSNFGAGLLGYILADMRGMSYDQLLQKTIAEKYHMTSTTAELQDVQVRLVKGRNAEGEIAANWEFDALAGAGAVLSNVQDLAKFALAQFDEDNKELRLTQAKTYKVSESMDIGLGWHIIRSSKGDRWHWHNGGTGGYSSSMALDINNESGVIILSNVSAFNDDSEHIDALCFDLLESINIEEE